LFISTWPFFSTKNQETSFRFAGRDLLKQKAGKPLEPLELEPPLVEGKKDTVVGGGSDGSVGWMSWNSGQEFTRSSWKKVIYFFEITQEAPNFQ